VTGTRQGPRSISNPRRLALTLVTAAAAAAAPAPVLAATGTNASATTSTAAPVSAVPTAPVCSTAVAAGHVRCFAQERLEQRGGPAVHSSAVSLPVGGSLSPADLQSAYAMPSAGAGRGQTVAVVDVSDDPNAESDLGVYRSTFGLPPCTTANGCFRKVNMGGNAQPDRGWSKEISLDLDMVSASCPNCAILLIEVPADASGSATVPAIAQGVTLAIQLGANQVSLSLGASEYSGEVATDPQLNRPGVGITASSGDSGYGVAYPAASPYVTAVGGTTLRRAANVRGWSDTVWSGTGSGCSLYEPKPAWQTDGGCPRRTDNDTAVVADPATGVAVYDSYQSAGWSVIGGTSVGAPLVAGMNALRGGAGGSGGQWAYSSPMNDVVSGSNGACSPAYLCTAGPGYDGPTGQGTPIGAPPGPPPSSGYWLVATDGGIFCFGNAAFAGSTGAMRLNQPIAGMARTASGAGYWLVARDGGIFSFGDAQFRGSTGAIRLNQPIVGMAVTPSGNGYWLVASDGGIFSFGDAQFRGSTGAMRLNQPIVGMAATSTGNGYWLVASDGGIFSFGDARFYGSTGAVRLNQPITGMAATPSGSGYWLVASDGGIFSFGDAQFRGSTGAIRLNRPIVGMAASRTGGGYWLVASDGGVFNFGDAAFRGSAGGTRLNQPVQGLAATA
jgi:hypothetical protein